MTTARWAWRATAPLALVADEKSWDAWLLNQGAQARDRAALDEMRLSGKPDIRCSPLVWVEDWSDEGGALVGEALARTLGDTSPATAVEVCIEWDASSGTPA